jgi:hypothetical protein
VFDLIRHKRHGDAAVLWAFDLIELDGDDLRRSSIEYRKRKLGKLLRAPHLGIVLNEHYEGDGNIIFKHACKLGCEGIVSKRAWLAISLWTLAALAEGQEPESASSQTRSRRGLGPIISRVTRSETNKRRQREKYCKLLRTEIREHF